MIGVAALIGAALGLGIIWLMAREGLLRDRSGLAVLLVAIASFYPVFSAAQGDVPATIVHLLIMGGFLALALRAFRRGTHLLAGGLIAHGIFDLAAWGVGAPGPLWWPAFCAALDIAAGVMVLRLVQTGRIKT